MLPRYSPSPNQGTEGSEQGVGVELKLERDVAAPAARAWELITDLAGIGRLFTGATKKALRQDLDDIATAAEQD